jgi:hypothetical protein
MIKRLLLTTALAALFCAPTQAKVDPNTFQLLETVDKYVTVKIDSGECNPLIYGYWDSRNEELGLCIDGTWDADDHDTLRHEVWHIIQLCHAPGPYLRPVMSTDKLYQLMIASQLTPKQQETISDMYPVYAEAAELEAFVIAATRSAAEIERMFISACIQ